MNKYCVAGGDAQNIGFSIPINDAKGLVQGVLASGELKKTIFGCAVCSAHTGYCPRARIISHRRCYINDSNGNESVVGSPAARVLDYKARTSLQKLTTKKVDANNTLASVIGRFKVGEIVTVTYIRDGQTKTTQVTIGELPAN